MANPVINISQAGEERRRAGRMRRIDSLFRQIQREISQGIAEDGLPESTAFEFIVPSRSLAKDGVVFCRFVSRPIQDYGLAAASIGPTGFYVYDN